MGSLYRTLRQGLQEHLLLKILFLMCLVSLLCFDYREDVFLFTQVCISAFLIFPFLAGIFSISISTRRPSCVSIFTFWDSFFLLVLKKAGTARIEVMPMLQDKKFLRESFFISFSIKANLVTVNVNLRSVSR